jgi:hypothetical protein
MLRAFTWKDTGLYSQFLRIQYSARPLDFPSISAYDVLWGTRFILEDTIAYDRLFVSFLCQSVAWFVLDGFPVFVIIGVFDSCC